jgi:hypothetical protein
MGIAALHPSYRLPADLPPWQIKSAPLGCGKSTRRANHFVFSEMVVQPLLQKYFASHLTQITSISILVLSQERGVAHVINVGRDAVDAVSALDETC